MYQFLTLTMRMHTTYWLNPKYVMIKINPSTLAGLLVGLAYFTAKVSYQFLASDFVPTFVQSNFQRPQNKNLRSPHGSRAVSRRHPTDPGHVRQCP